VTIPRHQPFVLLDDARAGGKALLYTGLQSLICARDPAKVAPALTKLRGASGAAGFLAYEAGLALEPKLRARAKAAEAGAPPLVWMGLFERSEEVDAAALLPDPAGAWCGAARPLIAWPRYQAAFDRICEHILDGDIYQANYTFPADVPVAGHPLALYAALRERARMGHGALIFTGEHWVLSFSPELFFTLEGGRITTRPMKGTAPRRADPAADAGEVEALASDPKQRSENLMIVDLLRNDLSRVSVPGTVRAPELFRVETYPTVHQLVSTVTGQLRETLGPVDIIEAIYPCGSVTGAPKTRAMEIIDDNEIAPRGIYCGAIGHIDGKGDAAFNVAIRTMVMKEGDATARLGLGSGIVAESRGPDEWRECLAKGAFTATQRRFDIIETMRHDLREGIIDLDRHLDRMKTSAAALGFAFDRHHARNELQAATFGTGQAAVRLLLARSGAIAVEASPMPPAPEKPVAVAVVPLPVETGDFRLRHKTSDRAFYDRARAAAGAFEVLFKGEGGFLTEGSFTNLFVERDGMLLTPPLARGLLPGVLRARLIDEGRAAEADLRAEDLRQGFLIGNALRGLMRAVLK
jgi:para-aminobenzoate synthetase / 4-amino-4-deoxychorismate lyase